MSLDADLAKNASSVLENPKKDAGRLYLTQEEKDARTRELVLEREALAKEIAQNEEDIVYLEKFIKELKKKNGGNFAGPLWKGMRITGRVAAGIATVAATYTPLRDGTLPHTGHKEGAPIEAGVTPPVADTTLQNPNDTLTWNTDTLPTHTEATQPENVPTTARKAGPTIQPIRMEENPIGTTRKTAKLDTIAVPAYVPPKVKVELVPKDTLTEEQKNGPKTLPTGIGTLPNGPGLPPKTERGRIQVGTAPGVEQPSGKTGPWKEQPKPEVKTPKKNEPVIKTPVKSGRPDGVEVIPVSPGHPHPEIIDNRIIPGGLPDDDEDDLDGYNSTDRIEDSTNVKVDTIVHRGGEGYAQHPEIKGDSYLRLTPAPGYTSDLPNLNKEFQDAINAFAQPSGKKLRIPDPDVKLTRAQYLESRNFRENSDEKFMDRIEMNPHELYIYLHNQAQEQSVGAYLMESNGKLYAIDKNGFLMFELPIKSEGEAGRSFITIVKEGDNAAHLEKDGVPFSIPGISDEKMSQLIKSGVLGEGSKGTNGFFYYKLPKNEPSTDENPWNQNTMLNYLDPRTGAISQKTYLGLHTHNQAILTTWRRNPNHYQEYLKTTQEYSGNDVEYRGHESMIRKPAAHFNRKVNNLIGSKHNGTALNEKEKGAYESNTVFKKTSTTKESDLKLKKTGTKKETGRKKKK